MIHFKERNAHSASLFFKSKIVKLLDKIKIENCLFISKYVNNKLPPIFNSWFIFSSTCHNYETLFAAKGHIKIPTIPTTTYGEGAFISMATKTWNNTQSQIKDPMMCSFSPNKLKFFLFNFCLNLYQTQDFIASSGMNMDDRFFWHILMDEISFDCLNCNGCIGFLVVHAPSPK